MSDSDQNERGRVPWWLKPLAGGRRADGDEVPAEEPTVELTEEPEAPVADPGFDEERLQAAVDDEVDETAGGASEPDLSTAVGDGALWSPERFDEVAEADGQEARDTDPPDEIELAREDEVAPEDEDSGQEEEEESVAAESDAGEAAPAKSGRGRSRRRGKRGGKKKNGNSGRARTESLAPVPFAAPEPEAVIEILPVPERTLSVNEERKLGVFCDFENIALGVRDSEIKRFDINIVLERLVEKGKVLVKKAYADWERYSDYKRKFHEAAIELIDIPQKYYSGKNSADIKMVVDALELSYTKDHLDTFVVMSGDSDFSPLVSKLKENNKYVIGVGVKNSSSNLLVDNCDEFIYYEDIWREMKAMKRPALASGNKNVKSTEAFNLLETSIKALMRDNKDVLWGSMIKQTMQRKKPSFNEGYYGYSTFSELLEDAERQKLVKLKKDQRSGTYIVTGFAAGR